ncbi:MAG: hypothetical protein HQK51_10260 [Oligoflexia bacterium]|nr:hypothetical protein [Oligoflexia bacterium]
MNSIINSSQLSEIFPNNLVLFDDIEVTSIDDNSSEQNFKKLEFIKDEVKNNLSALFTLKGDLKGYAVAILNDQSVVFDNKIFFNDDEGMVNLFIESVNIIIGNLLTIADEKLKLNSQFLSPLIFSPTTNSYFIKQSKLLSILEQKHFQECNILSRNYQLKFKDSSCVFTVILLIQFDQEKIQ